MDEDSPLFTLPADETALYVECNAARLPDALDADQLDHLIDQLKDLQNRRKFRGARSNFRSIRIKGRQGKRENKWHVLSRLESAALCSQGPSPGHGELEITESSPDLWDGMVCQQGGFAWIRLVQEKIIRFSTTIPTHPHKEVSQE